ncbi:MAG: GNAT family N-acetyltransferase [Flavobacteriaceae bacterium]|nr:GNAT family N-acetyltransferase [Flavobacteriaceae bacterium]MDZ4149408.1 GNAT family N-acetyltransferase [Flavobacteriaceae bacterium]
MSRENLILSEEVKLENCPIDRLDELVAVSRKAYIDNYRHIWTDSGANYLEKNFSQEVLEKDFLDANIVYFFVSKNDENIGFVKLHLDSAVENHTSAESIYLERLYLKKAYCGRGIGAEVMRKLFEFSEKHVKKVMWLRAMPSTPTVKFYERLGFRTVAEGKIPFPFIKPEHSPLYTMVKNLQN